MNNAQLLELLDALLYQAEWWICFIDMCDADDSDLAENHIAEIYDECDAHARNAIGVDAESWLCLLEAEYLK